MTANGNGGSSSGKSSSGSGGSSFGASSGKSSGKPGLRACAAQVSPVFLDKKRSAEKYAESLVEAGRRGVDLVVTPETGIAMYPYWRNNFGYSDPESARAWKETVAAFYDQAVRIPGPETEVLGKAARSAGLTAVIGVNEQDDRPGSRTLYNTMIFFGPDGEILGRHRKLMPTHQERIFWGRGDGSDLRVFETPFGTLGGLICFENHMTLLKAAMATLGEEVHAACWPGYWAYAGEGATVRDMSGTRHPLHRSDQDAAVREYAFETQTFVVSASMFFDESEVPADFPYRESANWKWAMGGSSIATPFGTYAAEPVFGKEELVIADLDLADRTVAKNVFDCMGHYARWDVAQLRLNRRGVGPEAEEGGFLAKLPLLAGLAGLGSGGGIAGPLSGLLSGSGSGGPESGRSDAGGAESAGAGDDSEGEFGFRLPGSGRARAIVGAVSPEEAKPLVEALSRKYGPGAVSAHRAELDSDDLDELARSHGLSHEEMVSLLHDFMDLIRRRSELVVPELEGPDEPTDA